MSTAGDRTRRRTRRNRFLALLGPGFVAAVAYVDPGNVAANLTAGARYGYLLVWVLVLSNAAAVLVQYLSAKLGIVTGTSLPEQLGRRLPRGTRIPFWLQAEGMAIATDIAEIIGGAIALQLLFDVPLVVGGVITGAVSMGLLLVQHRRRQRTFEFVIVGLLVVITVGFLAGLAFTHIRPGAVVEGLVPRFAGTDSVVLAASMLGATVMPHAIYLHSALTRDRHGDNDDRLTPRLLAATRVDIVGALGLAGTVNIGMLLLAASALSGVDGTDSIEGAHAALTDALGPAIGTVFAIGLLASGLASTAVGAAAGAEIMSGLLRARIPLLVRRLVTLIPALGVLALGVDPTQALVLSQVVLSLCIPFAIVPLVLYTGSATVMGTHRNRLSLNVIGWVVVAAIIALNLGLVWLTVTGDA